MVTRTCRDAPRGGLRRLLGRPRLRGGRGAAHVESETAIPEKLRGLEIRTYRAQSGWWAPMFGWEFANPRIDDEFPPNRSSFKLEVEAKPWAFTTRGTKQKAPLHDGGPKRWDHYHGFIHVPPARGK